MSTHSPIKCFLPHTHITFLNNSSTDIIGNNLNKLGIKTATFSSKTIRNLLHLSPRCINVSDVGVYCIPRKNCKSKYIGKTSMNIHKRLNEHWRDIRVGNLDNVLQQISKSDHNFDFNAVPMLVSINNKSLRQIFQASQICSNLKEIFWTSERCRFKNIRFATKNLKEQSPKQIKNFFLSWFVKNTNLIT